MKQQHTFFTSIASYVQRHWFVVSAVLILFLATFLHFYQLGNVPHGMTWDEAAIGYNGYAMLTTRRDEWLVRFPVSFQSFGDYKAPLPIYTNGIFTFLFGMNLWAVRFPFAVAGVFGVAGMMLLVYELFPGKYQKNLELTAGLLMTLSPWHIHFSRAGFESGMALTWMLFGLICLIKLIQHDQPRLRQVIYAIGTAVLLCASIYTYHSSKIVVPLLVIFYLLLHVKKAWSRKVILIVIAALSLFLLKPFIENSLYGDGSERLVQTTVVGLPISTNEKASLIVQHFFRNFSISYLIFGEVTNLRHGDGKWGVLYATEFVAVIASVIFFLFKKRRDPNAKVFLLACGWALIATLPAAIGREVPHGNRALLSMPAFEILALLGMMWLLEFLKNSKINKQVSGSKGEENLLVKTVLGIFIFCHVAFFLAYSHHYYTTFNAESTVDFMDGYIPAMEIAKANENDVDKILFTSEYSQPYIFALFVRKTNPIWYRGGSLIKYEFTDNIKESDRDRSNTLVVATPRELKPRPGDQLVYGADGSIRFIIFKTGRK